MIQALLGHKRLDTTAHYTRVATDLISKGVSPLDLLAKKGKKGEKGRTAEVVRGVRAPSSSGGCGYLPQPRRRLA